ncbi:ABC transporter ATP-binding protein [Methanobrevibacter sp.]|uniref:ABC transporter ATP-binding protein n=1 Tax=Methanobrevibacter sp. TaxID=66852 RepID=UPI00386F69AE
MNSENKNLKFSRNTNSKTNDKHNEINHHQQIRSKLMAKYNISSDEADRVINEIAKKNRAKTRTEKIGSIENNSSSKKEIKPNFKTNKPPKTIESKQKPNIKDFKKKTPKNNRNTHEFNSSNTNVTDNNKKRQNVDEILSNIVPNYEKKLSVELKNVNLTFDIIPDKIDTLKELVIRSFKRNKSKKMKFQVLEDISFKIYKGEKVGIIGYNGAGKSTLLKVICGIYPPDSGEVIAHGKISPLLSLGSGFDFNYSGRKNIYLNGAVLGYEKDFLKKKENEIIEFSELEEFIDIPIKNYSSGMLAKLGFSIATILEPDILIIDEILGVGDVTFHRKSHDKIKSLMGGGTTVFLVSHSIDQIKELCDKAIWIDNGKIKKIGEVNKICNEYLDDSKKDTVKIPKSYEFFNQNIYDKGISTDKSDNWTIRGNPNITTNSIGTTLRTTINSSYTHNILLTGDFEATFKLISPDSARIQLFNSNSRYAQIIATNPDWQDYKITRKNGIITAETKFIDENEWRPLKITQHNFGNDDCYFRFYIYIRENEERKITYKDLKIIKL